MHTVLAPERMVHGGRALARLEDGSVVLVAGALPGERVRAELQRRSGVALADTLEVLEPSPDRVEPTGHPGLDLDFASYERQLTLKAEVLIDAARRAGVRLPDATDPVRPSPRVWGYRSAIQPAVRGGRLGYRRGGSERVVPLASDPVANDALRGAWEVLSRASLPAGVAEVALRGNDEGHVLAALVTTVPDRELLDLGHALVREGIDGVAVAPFDPRGRFRSGKARLAGLREIRQRYGRVTLSVSATAFAQPNPDAASAMYETVREEAGTGGTAVELFAGSGVIGMHLASTYERVIAVEIAHESVTRGRRDAAREGVHNLEFRREDARRAPLPAAELIAVDPPRAGLAKDLRSRVTASQADRFVYVSCDVATWARDAADLTSRGWRLVRVRPFDFQPHTHHLELVTVFER